MPALRHARQIAPIDHPAGALRAVVAQILTSFLGALPQTAVAAIGGRQSLTMGTLPRLALMGGDDLGLSFDYAAHDLLRAPDSPLRGRIADALHLCRLPTTAPASLLFGLERSGAVQAIDPPADVICAQCMTLGGSSGRTRTLLGRLNVLAAAFRRAAPCPTAPHSLRGGWKSELFLGSVNAQRWVGAVVKRHPAQLEAGATLRIGIVPARVGGSDRVRLDDSRNLVICPLPFDAAFLQLFATGWHLLQAFLTPSTLARSGAPWPDAIEREVSALLEERRDVPAADVAEMLGIFGQADLLATRVRPVAQATVRGRPACAGLLAPVPLGLG